MAKDSYDIAVPPYDFSFKVFTDKQKYATYCKENKLWDKPIEDEASCMSADGFTSFNDHKRSDHLNLAVYLPKTGVIGNLDLEETIDHELIHVLFVIYAWFGVWVGKKTEYHETFCWHHNYLDRQIKTIIYGLKQKK